MKDGRELDTDASDGTGDPRSGIIMAIDITSPRPMVIRHNVVSLERESDG